MPTRPGIDEGHLRVREAAWLARVNDDTVRKWLRTDLWPRKQAVAGEPDLIAWQDLDDYCRLAGKTAPLPPDALALTARDFPRSGSGVTASPPTSQPPVPDSEAEGLRLRLAQTESALTQERRHAQGLRLALRERITGASHARSDAAAADRALTHLLDAAEDQARSEGG